MRKATAIFIALVLMGLPIALPSSVMAAFDPFNKVCNDGGNSDVDEAAVCNADDSNPLAEEGVLVQIVRLLSFVVGVAAVIMIILGGLKYVTSNGDANATSSAKNTILYAIIGVVVSALSQVIIEFVIRRT
jgi:hypothetical protein